MQPMHSIWWESEPRTFGAIFQAIWWRRRWQPKRRNKNEFCAKFLKWYRFHSKIFIFSVPAPDTVLVNCCYYDPNRHILTNRCSTSFLNVSFAFVVILYFMCVAKKERERERELASYIRPTIRCVYLHVWYSNGKATNCLVRQSTIALQSIFVDVHSIERFVVSFKKPKTEANEKKTQSIFSPLAGCYYLRLWVGCSWVSCAKDQILRLCVRVCYVPTFVHNNTRFSSAPIFGWNSIFRQNIVCSELISSIGFFFHLLLIK